MKKTKELNQQEVLQKLFPTKTLPIPKENDSCECIKCDNSECKCNQIMSNLANILELTEQIGHTELYNISLTILTTLQHLSDHEEDLSKIEFVCQEIYKNMNPKEMGHTIN
jgi:hypothetical protein